MAFFLSVDRDFQGGAKVEYDIGPTSRAQMLVPNASVHHVLALHPDQLVGQSLTAVRPPARTRPRSRGRA